MVLHDAPAEMPLRQVRADVRPARSRVRRAEDEGSVVTLLVVVHEHVRRARVEPVGADVVHEEPVGEIHAVLDRAPRCAAVEADVHPPVVGARPEHPLLDGGLREGGDRAEAAHGVGVPRRVLGPRPAHDRLPEAVDVPGEVPAHGAPRVAAIVAAPDPVTREVQARRIVGTDEDRRVPVEALLGLVRGGLRLDVDDLAGRAVVTDEVPLLPLRVDDVGVPRLGGRLVAVTEERHEPVRVGDAVGVEGARGTALGVVVLGAAVDVVEGLRVVEGDLVELRHGQVRAEAPRGAVVVGLVDAAVASHEQVLGVGGVEDQGVVVGVLRRVAEAAEVRAAVVGHVEPDVHLVDAAGLVRRGEDLLVVMGSGAPGEVVAALLPGAAAVERTPEAALALPLLDGRVDGARVEVADREADLAHVLGRQPAGELHPGLPPVRRLEDARLRTAVHEGRDGAVLLVQRGVEHVRVARVRDHLVRARVRPGCQDLPPGRAAVGGLVDAALAARRPERALGRDPERVTVLGVHDDAPDVLRCLEAPRLPAPPAVQAAVDAVPEPHVASADVLAGPDPDRARLARIDREAADRVARLVLEHGGPGRPAVLRLPDAAAPDGHVPGARILVVDRDVRDAARHERRADRAEREACEGRAGRVLRRLLRRRRSDEEGDGGQRRGACEGTESRHGRASHGGVMRPEDSRPPPPRAALRVAVAAGGPGRGDTAPRSPADLPVPRAAAPPLADRPQRRRFFFDGAGSHSANAP